MNISEGINVNKLNKSKECMICYYWSFLDFNYKYEPKVCDGCHDILMMACKLEKCCNTEYKGIDYKCVTPFLYEQSPRNSLTW